MNYARRDIFGEEMNSLINNSMQTFRLFSRLLPNHSNELQLNCQRWIQKLAVAGTGSPYDTRINRKRVVKDPNWPSFELNKHGLEYTNWKMLRDLRRRIICSELNPQRVCLQSMYKNRNLPQTFKEEIKKDINEMPRASSLQLLTDRCCITSRPRGRVRKWRMSRIMFRHLADYNFLSGVMKSTWGP